NILTEILIRKVTLNELPELQQIGKRTFAETFASENSEENMQVYLEKGFSVENLRSELADENSEFFFAVLDAEVTQYLTINFGASETEIKDANSLEIERIYVLRDFHGKKVGQKLYEKAMEIGKKENLD